VFALLPSSWLFFSSCFNPWAAATLLLPHLFISSSWLILPTLKISFGYKAHRNNAQSSFPDILWAIWWWKYTHNCICSTIMVNSLHPCYNFFLLLLLLSGNVHMYNHALKHLQSEDKIGWKTIGNTISVLPFWHACSSPWNFQPLP